jgi:hypothetical protein
MRQMPPAKEREMDRKRMISLLQRSAAATLERTPFCPDDEEIAAFVDGVLDDVRRESVQHHLPDCPACIQRVGLVTRLLRASDNDHKAEPKTLPEPMYATASRWAVAASVLIAVAWFAWMPMQEDQDRRTTRALESTLPQPEILAPMPGIAARRDNLVIRWTEVPESLYYEVRIVSDAGDLVSLQRVDVAEWTLDDETDLDSGQEYFIRVDAYLTDSQSLRSDHIPFRVKD